MRSAGANATRGVTDGRQIFDLLAQGLVVAGLCAGLFWLVWIYGMGLRDPRYLDGWVLAGGMTLQLGFHVALKSARLSPRSAARWRKIHIWLGYVLIAVFVSHCDFTLPDTALEWALWAGFVLVTATGVLGTYLTWSLKAKGRIDEAIGYDRIPRRCAELAREVHAVAVETEASTPVLPLPGLPHDAWILDLYANHLREFFEAPRNATAHLLGSQRPLRRLIAEIDGLSRYVDQQGRERLAVIKNKVIEKDGLDFARVHLGLTKGWLLVHVPVTYSLVVLTVLHVVVAYAYSSGVW